MKVWALPTSIGLLVAALTVVLRPPAPVLFGVVALCLAVGIAVGWSCAVRARSFSAFGFTDVKFEKPFTAKLTTVERSAVQLSAAVLLGTVVGVLTLVLLDAV